MCVKKKKITLGQYLYLKERSEDLHSEGLNANAQVIVPVIIIFSFVLFSSLYSLLVYKNYWQLISCLLSVISLN